MDCGHIAQRHSEADDQRHQRRSLIACQPIGGSQPDIGIEAERGLHAGFKNHRSRLEENLGQPAHCNAAQARGEHDLQQLPGGREVERCARCRVEQQRREEDEIDQLLHSAPECGAPVGAAHEHKAKQNQCEVGQQDGGDRHRKVGGARSPGVGRKDSTVQDSTTFGCIA